MNKVCKHNWETQVIGERKLGTICTKCGILKIENDKLIGHKSQNKHNRDFSQFWACNECNTPNFTQSVSQEEIELGLHGCINCGGVEFHIENDA